MNERVSNTIKRFIGYLLDSELKEPLKILLRDIQNSHLNSSTNFNSDLKDDCTYLKDYSWEEIHIGHWKDVNMVIRDLYLFCCLSLVRLKLMDISFYQNFVSLFF